MYSQVKDPYAKAYVEILEIIKNMDEKCRDKIPTKLIDFFEENKDSSYEFVVDSSKKEIISSKTVDLLTLIELNYLTNGKDKEILEKALIENDKRNEEDARLKYNPDNIFNSNNFVKAETKKIETAVIEKEEKTFFEKIIEWFKGLFK